MFEDEPRVPAELIAMEQVVLLRHVLPNVMHVVLISLVLDFSGGRAHVLARADTAAGQVTHHFSETRPLSTYLVAFAAGPWRQATRSPSTGSPPRSARA